MLKLSRCREFYRKLISSAAAVSEIGLIRPYFVLNRITFCGITMKNYVESNISETSQTTVRHTMKMLSHGSEAIIFLFLGVNTVHDKHQWNTPFIFLTVIFCTVFRGIGNVPFRDYLFFYILMPSLKTK